tara:strand:- start:943 stop:1257 length:315 start_codon:yes stop_codon:yes gene_type:complete
MSKAMLNGSEIREAVGADNLKTLRKEYQVLELVNWLQEKVHVLADLGLDEDGEEAARIAEKITELLRVVADDYGMVSARSSVENQYKSNLMTFKGEHDEWVGNG